MTELMRMYIDGNWVMIPEIKRRSLVNPATGENFGWVCEGSQIHAKRAITAARKAFNHSWWSVEPLRRAGILHWIADEMEKRIDVFARAETLNTGKTLAEAQYDVEDAVSCLRYFAERAGNDHMPCKIGETDHAETFVVREPVGVCGLIVPWNYPLATAMWKMAPALAAGNAVVLKPASLTPLTACLLFELFDASGIPKGIVNLVLGSGETVGQALVESHEVDFVSFTGSTDTGRSVMRGAAGNIKKVALELGGKSPNIVFDDADLDQAVNHAVDAIFYNQGQVCSAGSRLLIQDTIYEKFLERLIEKTEAITLGNGMDPDTQMGPLISESHMTKVLEYIQKGIDEGARLLTGGTRLTSGAFKKGFFVQPTIFDQVDQDMVIVREEIFGPVLVVQSFKSEQEAIDMANDTDFGLAGGVFTQDQDKGLRVCRKIRAGVMWLNTYNIAPIYAPWGGYKQSGIGREMGIWGYEEYTEVKQINIQKNG